MDLVFLKVSSTKGGVQIGRQGKLSIQFIGPFKVLRQVGKVAYELALPSNFLVVCQMFHVFILKNYMSNGPHKLRHEELNI